MLPGDFVRRGVFAGKFGKSKQLSSTYPNFFNFSDFPNTTFPIFSTKAKIPRESYHLGIFNSRRVIFTGYVSFYLFPSMKKSCSLNEKGRLQRGNILFTTGQ